jgi:ubiquinone/menaquinone biosynthesis C-methylase UbiE
MHSLARRMHTNPPGKPPAAGARRWMKRGWSYDLATWFFDTFVFHGQLHQLRQRTVTLAHVQLGEAVLDVGCSTGTLALEVARRVGRAGRVVGIDPGAALLARARAKAARRHLPIEFQDGVIEHLPFPDHAFDVVFSTLMIHHLPVPRKRQGLTEVARVLKPGGRLVLADFTHHSDRSGRAARFHAGGSRLPDLAALVSEAGFVQVETEEMPQARSSAFPGAGFVWASRKSDLHG